MAEERNVWEYFQTETSGIFEGNYSRAKFLVERFPPGGRILNIGVGNGRLEQLALARGLEVYCLDPGEKSIQLLREKLALGDRARVGSSDAIPFGDGYFDGVVMTEVLEHLEPEVMTRTLSEVGRVLKEGGLFAGTIPSNEDLSEQGVVCPKCGDKFHKWGHKQSFTAERFAEVLSAGFRVLRAERRLFTPWNILNWKGKLEAVVKIGLFRTGMLGDRWLSIFFLCEKRGAPSGAAQ